MKKMKKIILASRSKRRAAILKSCNISHIVAPGKTREMRKGTKKPAAIVMLNAKRKAESVAIKRRKGIIIGADTMVFFNGKLLGKPHTKGEAKKMLAAFSGNRIMVYSGLHVIDLDNHKKASGFATTALSIKKIPQRDIDKYFTFLGPYDKAGGFSIEGIGSIVFDDIKGSYFNVLGLPMAKLQGLFRKIGLDLLDFTKKEKTG